MLLFFGARMQLMSAALIAATVMTYPILRGADLVPTDRIHSFFSKIDTDRASTLQYRFNAEDLLLERANQKHLRAGEVGAETASAMTRDEMPPRRMVIG